LAQAILAYQDSKGLLSNIATINNALWKADTSRLQLLSEEIGAANEADTKQKLISGNELRKKLQHYSGATFYHAGEWYCGIDRLFHLEERLRSLGADKASQKTDLTQRPDFEVNPRKDNGSLTLEIYASLRSPYTAIVFDRAVQLAKNTGVRCVVRPVLPMVMRGVPATKEKGLYILFDTAREARANHVP
jgi:2-hydroxychromene-2-carboxylate isomerase